MIAPQKLFTSSEFIGHQPDHSSSDLETLLGSLYRQHLLLNEAHPYILEHQKPACIKNQVRTFHWYRPYLPTMGAVLDWGCYHAPDACLLRAWYGDRLELHGCDFADRNAHRVFHDFAKTEYRQLSDNVELPYQSGKFDTIIASGVLEHTAMDYESLKELHRVLKEDGLLIISYLPNSLSVGEWILRNIHKKNFHRRLYNVSDTIQLLKHSGFYPKSIQYHTFFWERLVERIGLGRWSTSVSGLLKTVLPLQILSSTHRCIAQKVKVM
jgi:ubiquinone/menaquinone biosynthesis C-methylase UbiE